MNNRDGISIAIVGATGAVGREMLLVLEKRQFPFSSVRLFASPRSEGKKMRVRDREITCEVLKPNCFDGTDIVFFDASDAISKEWVPQALESKCWVVDNSATYRMDPTVPLMVPEINSDLLPSKSGRRLIAGPNCSTVQLVLPLFPLSKKWGLKRVIVSTFQSVSGAGSLAIDELMAQSKLVSNGHAMNDLPTSVFAHPIAFNCIPQIGKIGPDGFSSEENKIISEAKKILSQPDLRISATAVRIPTMRSHAESVNLELNQHATLNQLMEAIKGQKGVQLVDDLSKPTFAMNLNASHQDEVLVSRIRPDASIENGFHLWIVGDNLLKGAALNAVQIGECILDAKLH